MYAGQPRIQLRQEGRFLTNNRTALPLTTLRTRPAHEAAPYTGKSPTDSQKAFTENGLHRMKVREENVKPGEATDVQYTPRPESQLER